MASASNDFTIILWDTDEGKIAHEWVAHSYTSIETLAFSPDSRYLASGGDHGKVVIWDLFRNAAKVSELKGHTSTVSGCAWSPDGRFIASASKDGTVRLWDAHTFQHVETLMRGSTEARCLVFSSNGRWLASGFSVGNVCIWRVVPATLRKFISNSQWQTEDGQTAIAFDPEGMRLATSTATCRTDTAVKIYGVETGECLFTSEHTSRINDFSFSPDGKLLLGATEDGTLRIWDTDMGLTEVFVLQGHTGPVLKACFSPCGVFIASASCDGTVRLWRTRDGTWVETFSEYTGKVTHVVFAPDGKTLWFGEDNGTVFFRRMSDILPLDDFLLYYLSSPATH